MKDKIHTWAEIDNNNIITNIVVASKETIDQMYNNENSLYDICKFDAMIGDTYNYITDELYRNNIKQLTHTEQLQYLNINWQTEISSDIWNQLSQKEKDIRIEHHNKIVKYLQSLIDNE